MSTLFNVHNLSPQQQKQANTYSTFIKSTKVSAQQLSIAIFGAKQSGKTTCALDLGQCPFTELPPSPSSSVLQSVIITPNQPALSFTIHDATDFVLTNTVLFIVNAQQPDSTEYLKQFIQYLHESQLVFILLNKCDLATPEQFSQSYASTLNLQSLINSRPQILPCKLQNNSSFPMLQNVITLSINKMRFENAKVNVIRCEREFKCNLLNNNRLFFNCLNESLQQKCIPQIQLVNENEIQTATNSHFKKLIELKVQNNEKIFMDNLLKSKNNVQNNAKEVQLEIPKQEIILIEEIQVEQRLEQNISNDDQIDYLNYQIDKQEIVKQQQQFQKDNNDATMDIKKESSKQEPSEKQIPEISVSNEESKKDKSEVEQNTIDNQNTKINKITENNRNQSAINRNVPIVKKESIQKQERPTISNIAPQIQVQPLFQ
ncbi:Conserved_hypothetical protein [Hexamita inflata]|uniref:Uncharacterized protein n=1 Tax=Hexamita inflata TaxID=28002 RepID=A0AA86Q8E1_9EUKA|nr:Conserved hypothetical protein [Hexamita inflata]CAI9952491.1 Conserved hypothetical protein [Hexamita inflata]